VLKGAKPRPQRVTRRAPEDLVFGNRRGMPLRESKLLTTVLQPAAERASLGRVTWHQFRHIHSSLLNDLRVPVKIAQQQLGHSSISTTLNLYTHVVDASHRQRWKPSKSACSLNGTQMVPTW
jgi:integrase